MYFVSCCVDECFFFFKQKTAYEMRISDWSSDVCSSDLQIGAVLNVAPDHLGTKGIETLADLAKVKSVVVESVARQGHSVLNFDDPITRGMASHERGRVVWFALDGRAHRGGGLAEPIGAGDMAVLGDSGPQGGPTGVYTNRDPVWG